MGPKRRREDAEDDDDESRAKKILLDAPPPPDSDDDELGDAATNEAKAPAEQGARSRPKNVELFNGNARWQPLIAQACTPDRQPFVALC